MRPPVTEFALLPFSRSMAPVPDHVPTHSKNEDPYTCFGPDGTILSDSALLSHFARHFTLFLAAVIRTGTLKASA